MGVGNHELSLLFGGITRPILTWINGPVADLIR